MNKLLDRRDVDISIVEEGFKFGHVASNEAPIVGDGVTAQRRNTLIDPLFKESHRQGFCLAKIDFRQAYDSVLLPYLWTTLMLLGLTRWMAAAYMREVLLMFFVYTLATTGGVSQGIT